MKLFTVPLEHVVQEIKDFESKKDKCQSGLYAMRKFSALRRTCVHVTAESR